MPFGGLLTVGIISAGAQIYGAHKASSAANKAADQQVAATDKGLALQQQIYNEQKAGMQPYAQFGQQALGSLGSLMGFAPLPAGAVPPMTPQEAAVAGNDPNNPASARETITNTTGEYAVPRNTLGAIMSRSAYDMEGSAPERLGGQGGRFTGVARMPRRR